MAVFDDRIALDFSDVLLVPQHSKVVSRTKVDPRTRLGELKLASPIVSSNMSVLTEARMAIAMGEVGGLGILHRYATTEQVLTWIKEVRDSPQYAVPSIGIQGADYEKAVMYLDAGASAITVDVAHGHTDAVQEIVAHCARIGFETIIAGNVVTSWACRSLINAGANVIKVGVGPSGVCTTRTVTGHGLPQLTALMECYPVVNEMGAFLISDGGCKDSGDVVKALVFSDAVMLGGMLSGTDEVPERGRYVYAGMASAKAQIEGRGYIGNGTPEGTWTSIEPKGPVRNVVEGIVGGIRSGCSYSGAYNLDGLRENAVLRRVNRVK